MKNRYIARVTLFFVPLLIVAFSHASDWTYSVRQGDTLWGLCIKYTNVPNCWQKVGPYNNVEYPRSLAPGTRIRFPVAWLKEQPTPARVSLVKGNVTKTPIDGVASQVNFGDLLTMGTRLVVPLEGILKLTFADKSEMTVEGDSELVLDKLSHFGNSGMVDTRVHLRRGSVQTRVPKRQTRYHFEVTTPSSVAAVRGTDFRVTSVSDRDLTRNEVFSGSVSVSNENEEKLLPTGNGLITEKGKPLPEVVTLPIAPILTDADEKQVLPFTFEWQEQADIGTYKVELLHEETRELRMLGTTNENNILLADLPNACYRLRISAIGNSGLQGMPSEKVHCVHTPLAAAEMVMSEQKDDGSTEIRWQPVTGAKKYRIEIASAKNFKSPTVSEHTQKPSFHFKHEQTGILYARVVAIDEESNEGLVSTAHEFGEPEPTNEKTGLFFTMFLMAVLLIL